MDVLTIVSELDPVGNISDNPLSPALSSGKRLRTVNINGICKIVFVFMVSWMFIGNKLMNGFN